MKNKTIFLLLINILFVSKTYSDTLVVCQSDTLKLAYSYQGISYADSCDVFEGDTIYLASDAYVLIWIEEPTNHFLPILNHFENGFCHSNMYLQEYAIILYASGRYTLNAVDTTNKEIASSFYIIKEDSSALNKSTIRASINPNIEYQLTAPDYFKNYAWSTGSNNHTINVSEPGNYSVQVTNHCTEIFNKNFELNTKDFFTNQFYAGKDTGQFVSYTDVEPDLVIAGHPIFDTIDLDVDNDGVLDLSFLLDHMDAMGGGSKDFNISPLYNCEVQIRDNPKLVDKLDAGILINGQCVFSDYQKIHLLNSAYSIFGGGCTGGYWKNSSNYLGFKINSDETTTYGWIRITLSSSYQYSEFILHDYAITSETVGVKDLIADQVKIFPNPFKDNLSVSNVSPNSKLNIYNLLGILVYEQSNLTKKQRINLTHLSSGVYFAELIPEDNQHQVLIIIKE